MLEPAVNVLGCELVGIEFIPQGRRSLLRIYIDKEDGVTIDDCSDVSHQVSGVLEVEDPIREQYTLEVSSPGLDRPLFSPEQFARFVGETVQLSLFAPREGRRKFKGRILGVEGAMVTIEQDGNEVTLEHGNIAKARLVPDYDSIFAGKA